MEAKADHFLFRLFSFLFLRPLLRLFTLYVVIVVEAAVILVVVVVTLHLTIVVVAVDN